jgi:hypothetical protein
VTAPQFWGRAGHHNLPVGRRAQDPRIPVPWTHAPRLKLEHSLAVQPELRLRPAARRPAPLAPHSSLAPRQRY